MAAGKRRLGGLLEAFREDENGATVIEYALIIGLIFLTIVAAVTNYTNTTSEMYDTIDTTLTDAIGTE